MQTFNDISSLKLLKQEDSTDKTNQNQSIIIKDYYKPDNGSSLQEVFF